MRLLFMAAKDLLKSKFISSGGKTLLETDYGVGEKLALCGRLDSWQKAENELRLTLCDPDSVEVIAGEHSSLALNNADSIIRKNKVTYVLVYCQPSKEEKLLLHEIIEVTPETFRRFHEIARKAAAYLIENPQKAEYEENSLELSEDSIVDYIRENDSGSGVPLSNVLKKFSNPKTYEKILELMDAGRLMEPQAGRIRALD